MSRKLYRVRKRILSLVLTAVLFAGLFCGCSYQNTQESVSHSAKETDLEVWICYDRNVPGAYYAFLWDSLAEEYGYTIDIRTYTQQEIKNKLRMALVCNELPDIFYVPGGSYSQYLFDAGVCMPVQDYLNQADFAEKYTQVSEDGNNYLIPCYPESYAVAYYDTELMAEIGLEVPETWDELISMVEKVNAYNAAHGTSYSAIGIGEKDNWMGELLFSVIAHRIDPQLYHSEQRLDIDFYSDVFEQAAESMQQLVRCNAFPEEFLETGEPEAVKDFINHETVMMVHQSSLVYHLTQNMGADGFLLTAFPSCNEAYNDSYQNYVLEMNDSYTPGLAVSAASDYREEAASLCLDFAQQVNRINVESYGYLNISSTSYDTQSSVLANVQTIHTMEDNAERTDPFLGSLFMQADEDTWGNIVKQLIAGELDVQKFLSESAALVEK